MLRDDVPTRRAPRMGAILRRIEAMNVSGAERHWALMPRELALRMRPRVVRIGDGLLTLMAKSDSLIHNRMVGLGRLGAAKESMIDVAIATCREAGLKRFAVMPAPGPQSEEISGWLMTRGFVPKGGHTVLLRRGHPRVPKVETTVRVARALRAQRPIIVAIHEATFGMPPSRRAWALAAAGAPGREHYLGFVRATPVAVGTLRVEGRLAWLGWGATLTRCAPARRARRGECRPPAPRRASRLRVVWVETSPSVPGRPQVSYRNLIRLGFRKVADRPQYVWRGVR